MSISDWYLIYTKPKQERMAEENLVRQGYTVYLPFIYVQRHRKGRYRLICEPMFPRYLFIQLNTKTDDWRPIRSTRGVSTLVQFGGIPAKVPTELIEFLKMNEQDPNTLEKHGPEFYSGQNVRILSGVMAGYEGIFQAKSSSKRVTVLLDIVGKVTRVEVSIDSVGSIE